MSLRPRYKERYEKNLSRLGDRVLDKSDSKNRAPRAQTPEDRANRTGPKKTLRLLDIILSSKPSAQQLIECVYSNPSFPLLRELAMSHPACGDEVVAAAALLDYARAAS